jgi:hypothetical protein
MGASPREDRTEYHFYFTSPPLPGETGDPDNDGRVAVSGTAHSFDRLVKGNLTRGYVDRVPALQKEAGEASVTTVVHELREEQKQTLLQQMHSGVGTISQISAKERNWFDDNFADANATEVSRRLQQKKRDDDRYRGSGTPPPPAKKS